jgi:hypothetical protein
VCQGHVEKEGEDRGGREDVKASTSERRQRNGQKTTGVRFRIRLTIYNAVLAAAAVSKRLLSGALSADKPMYAGSWRTW